jgi:hypothetical protein
MLYVYIAVFCSRFELTPSRSKCTKVEKMKISQNLLKNYLKTLRFLSPSFATEREGRNLTILRCCYASIVVVVVVGGGDAGNSFN